MAETSKLELINSVKGLHFQNSHHHFTHLAVSAWRWAREDISGLLIWVTFDRCRLNGNSFGKRRFWYFFVSLQVPKNGVGTK